MIYPRELPNYGLVDCTFNLTEAVSVSRTEGGRVVSAVEYADPHLTVTVETNPMMRQDRAVWEAWRASLRGGLKTFVAYDASRPQPLAYPDGHPDVLDSSWSGDGAATAIAAHLITASGAPSGYIASEGDLIGLVQDGRRWVGFVSETSTESGGSIAVTVDPAVPLAAFSTGAVVSFYRPKAEFILLPSSWQCSKKEYLAPVRFEGVQKI